MIANRNILSIEFCRIVAYRASANYPGFIQLRKVAEVAVVAKISGWVSLLVPSNAQVYHSIKFI